MYLIPKSIIDEFVKISAENKSPEDGKHIETLAFLVGYKEDGNVVGTHIIFPKQTGDPGRVCDDGKY